MTFSLSINTPPPFPPAIGIRREKRTDEHLREVAENLSVVAIKMWV
jgi:hypothetical protein